MRQAETRNLLPIILATALVATAPSAPAQDETEGSEPDNSVDLFDDDVENTTNGWSRFNMALGLTRLDADGIWALQLPGQEPVTIINFDRVGLNETDNSHWFSLTWRSQTSRWGAWFGNWRYDVNGALTWEEEINLPNKDTIPVGAWVESEFDANWYILEATYSLFRSRTVDAGLGFGLHTVDIDTRLSARIDIGEGEYEVVQGDLDTIAPLPNVLAYVHWQFLPRWDMIGRMGWFGLDYDKYSGQMTNAHLMISYQLSDRFSLGGAYQFVSLDIDIDEDYYVQKYDIDFSGPMFFMRYRF